MALHFIFECIYWLLVVTACTVVASSDESKPSWLELNDFQFDSARLVTFSIQLENFIIQARNSVKKTNFGIDCNMVKIQSIQLQKHFICCIKDNEND